MEGLNMFHNSRRRSHRGGSDGGDGEGSIHGND